MGFFLTNFLNFSSEGPAVTAVTGRADGSVGGRAPCVEAKGGWLNHGISPD